MPTITPLLTLALAQAVSLVAAQTFTIPPLSPALPAIGGALTNQNGALGFAASSAGVTTASAAATGGLVNAVTLVSSGTPSDANAPPASAPLSVGDLPTQIRYVPDYRANSPPATATATATSQSTSAARRKVKIRKYPTPTPVPAAVPEPQVCWVISKRCCYEPVRRGYRCKDYYVYKYARCHPVIEYEQICGKITEHPSEHTKPKRKVRFDESMIKNYDSRYGPHVPGYPGGESEFYDTNTLPTRPYGVEVEPFSSSKGVSAPAQTNQNGPTVDQKGGYESANLAEGNTSASGGYQQPRATTSGGAYKTKNQAGAGAAAANGPPDTKPVYESPPVEQNPPVASVDTPVQADGTYRYLEPREEFMK